MNILTSHKPHLDDKDIYDLLDYGQYRNYVYKPKLKWCGGFTRNDVIIYDKVIHVSELTKDLHFDNSVDTTTRATTTDIIEEY